MYVSWNDVSCAHIPVIVTVPGPLAVTTPFDTDAMALLLLDHKIVLSTSGVGLLNTGVRVTLSCNASPIYNVSVDGVNPTSATTPDTSVVIDFEASAAVYAG